MKVPVLLVSQSGEGQSQCLLGRLGLTFSGKVAAEGCLEGRV